MWFCPSLEDYPSTFTRTGSLFKANEIKKTTTLGGLKEYFLTLWQLCNGITISLVHFTEELQRVVIKVYIWKTYHRSCVSGREPKAPS